MLEEQCSRDVFVVTDHVGPDLNTSADSFVTLEEQCVLEMSSL